MASPTGAKAFEGRSESPVLEQTGTHSAEDWVTQGVHATEHGPEGQESDPEHSERWQAAAEEYVDSAPVPVSPDLSEMMHDPRTPVNNYDAEEEEEEFVVLGPDHDLVKRHQAALNVQLNKELERINSALKEKLALEKADESEMEDLSMEIYRINENLVRLQCKLDDLHQTKAESENKHLQILEQLEANKSQFSSTTNKHKQTKVKVSQLQSEMERLMLNLTFTQEVKDKLQSDLKTMKNTAHKTEVEKFKAEEEKRKQDLYVERLTKKLEGLTEQVALHDTQTRAQADETKAAKDALSEAEMEMISLLMARKQLWQQWNSSLIGMKKQGEIFTAMQEAARMLEHQLLSLDSDIKGYNKTIMEAQEQNEMLTMELNRAQMDNATTKSQINQKQAQQEALQSHYSTTLRMLQETERTLAELTKETRHVEADLEDQRRKIEKESALRMELEDKIVNAMQQSLIHSNTAKNLQKISQKLTVLKKKKIMELWQLENEILSAELERSEIGQNLDNLILTQKGVDEEAAQMDKLLSDIKGKTSSSLLLITQKQNIILKLNKKIDQIAIATGNQDLSPLQIEINAIKLQMEELEKNKNYDHHLWIKRQGALMELTQELENRNKNFLQLQMESTFLQQERIRLENLIEGENKDKQDLQKNTQALKRDLTRLNTLLNKNTQLGQSLEQDNALMQADFTKKLQEEELESIKMKMKWEKNIEEKERLLNCLIEAERQIMLWENKIQIVKETYAAVQGDGEQADRRRMKAEIHRMEVRLSHLMKEREQLLRESEATVARRETIVLRRESLLNSSPNRQSTKGELQRLIQNLQRKITTAHKQLTECEQVIKELQENQASVGSRLSQQKQKIIDLCGDRFAREQDLAKLQEEKVKNFLRLVVLQNRSKKLQSVKDNSYKPVSNFESVGTAIQSQMERVCAISTILHRVCQDFPQHQEALRRLTLAVAAHSQEKLELPCL